MAKFTKYTIGIIAFLFAGTFFFCIGFSTNYWCDPKTPTTWSKWEKLINRLDFLDEILSSATGRYLNPLPYLAQKQLGDSNSRIKEESHLGLWQRGFNGTDWRATQTMICLAFLAIIISILICSISLVVRTNTQRLLTLINIPILLIAGLFTIIGCIIWNKLCIANELHFSYIMCIVGAVFIILAAILCVIEVRTLEVEETDSMHYKFPAQDSDYMLEKHTTRVFPDNCPIDVSNYTLTTAPSTVSLNSQRSVHLYKNPSIHTSKTSLGNEMNITNNKPITDEVDVSFQSQPLNHSFNHENPKRLPENQRPRSKSPNKPMADEVDMSFQSQSLNNSVNYEQPRRTPDNQRSRSKSPINTSVSYKKPTYISPNDKPIEYKKPAYRKPSNTNIPISASQNNYVPNDYNVDYSRPSYNHSVSSPNQFDYKKPVNYERKNSQPSNQLPPITNNHSVSSPNQFDYKKPVNYERKNSQPSNQLPPKRDSYMNAKPLY